MVSREKYEKIITSFLNKYKSFMDDDMNQIANKLWLWIKEYEANMSKNVSIENKKMYVKRGANLMRMFVDSYMKLSVSLSDSLQKCRLALLRGDTKVCNEKTKRELTILIKDYNAFTQAMIGCNDQGTDYILSLLVRISDSLGADYVKIKNDMELRCLSLRKEALLID